MELSPRTSLTGAAWGIRPCDDRVALALAQRHGLPEVLARILAARGVPAEEVDAFLNPSLKSSLPDPSHLLDMDVAAERVAKAVMSGEKIAIFGDYDVDGATSSALLCRYFRALGTEPVVYIPDRMKEGYGPNAPALLSLRRQGVTLAITVDCGTLSFEPLAAAHAAGLDVIVIDHHAGEARKPKAVAIVNPNRLDETSPHRQLAAVGVAFLLAVAVNRVLRARGYFASRPEPDLKQWLDLVALGTICDVVPLIGVNRSLVAQGLKVMAARHNTGIRTLLDLASVEEKPGVYHAGFVVGPRINAGGRVGRSDLGTRLLSTDDPAEALELARELDKHNAERKTLESMVMDQAFERAKAMLDKNFLLVISGKGWHQGVIGIVAGRIKERYQRPVAVIAVENGIGKASARSIPGFDMGAAVIAAHDAGLLLAGGGHTMAAGFTVEEEKIPALTEFLCKRLPSMEESALAALKQLMIDASLNIGGATAELVEMLDRLGPYGQANPPIKVAIRNVVNLKPERAGEDHIKSWFKDPQGSGSLSGIAFRARGTRLEEALFATKGQIIDIAGQIRMREWMGKRSVSIIIEDIASCA